MKKIILLVLISAFSFFLSCEHLTNPVGADSTKIIEDSSYIVMSTYNLEDFEVTENWECRFMALADYLDGGNSTFSISFTNDAIQGTNAMFCQYHFGPDNLGYRYARLDIFGWKDLNNYNAVSFRLKGSGSKLRVNICSSIYQKESVFGKYIDNNFGYVIDATPSDWTTYTIPFSDFAQEEDWPGGGMVFSEILRQFTTLSFAAYSYIEGETGWFIVDDVKFLYIVDKR